MDLPLLSVCQVRLMRRFEATELRLRNVDFRKIGAGLLHIPQSKTDQEGEETVLYLGRAVAEALQAIKADEETLKPNTAVFKLSTK